MPIGYDELAAVQAGGVDSIRLTDPSTGAGLVTTNSDPNVVGVDPLTGQDAPEGTDVGFGSPFVARIEDGLYNGDFLSPPPDPDAPLCGVPEDAGYNIPPYWGHHPGADGLVAASWSAGSVAFDVPSGATDDSWVEQLVRVGPECLAAGHAYVAFAVISATDANLESWVSTCYLQDDAATMTGSEVERVAGEFLFAGLASTPGPAPSDAAYLRVRIGVRGVPGFSGRVSVLYAGIRRGADVLLLDDMSDAARDPSRVRQYDGSLYLEPPVAVVIGQPQLPALGTEPGGGVAFTGIAGPYAIGSNRDDWAPGGTTEWDRTEMLIVEPTGATRTISGLQAPSGDRDGTQKVVYNTSGTQSLVLEDQATSASSAQNRFACPNNANLTIRPRAGVVLRWFGDGLGSSTARRWRVISQV